MKIQREGLAQLLALIAEKAATPEGFFVTDAEGLFSTKTAHKHCKKQFDAGLLFRVSYGGYAYFSTQAGADALAARQKAEAKRSKAAGYTARNQERVAQRKKDSQQRRGLSEPTHSEYVIRRPAAPVRPRDDAEIVHTAKTRYFSTGPMLERFAVSKPYLRIGDAGWSMRI